ncbi:MAG: hypothetical protein U0031_07185 [Thermomicrobiales bacterium]
MASESPLAHEGLAAFRRAYRWLNLTLVHQGLWPLLIVVFGAPAVPVGLTDGIWYPLRVAGPLLGALLALAYLSQRPEGLPSDQAIRTFRAGSERDRRLREQMTILIVGVAAAVALLRLWQGPLGAVAKLEVFALADVAAYQAINFGVAGRGVEGGWRRLIPVGLFALSWGLHDAFLSVASGGVGEVLLTFFGGAVVGLLVGAGVWMLRQWPGGYLSAAAAQFLVVYLILGFLA